MGIFNKIFGESDNKDNQQNRIHWNHLTESSQLHNLISASFEKPVFIFKHSTRCAISRMALKQFENHYNMAGDNTDGYFLDLLEYRSVSNEIANRFKVMHQSPQLILIRDGKCDYTVSHSDIDAQELHEKITEKTE